MYSNIDAKPTIVYDPDIVSKIKEMIEAGFEKLKSFVKSKNNSKFDIYQELRTKLESIANRLRNVKLFRNEFIYFRSIKRKILYILNRNCENRFFGYCDFALELLKFFMEIWDAKIRLITNFSQEELEIYKNQKDLSKRRCHDYRREFYCNIFEANDEFSQDEIYKIHESLRE